MVIRAVQEMGPDQCGNSSYMRACHALITAAVVDGDLIVGVVISAALVVAVTVVVAAVVVGT